ncbi:MAG: hypothetical protein ACI8PP_002200 [Candidatus Pseudothioglobus sp.]|jgi:hypothetical protein
MHYILSTLWFLGHPIRRNQAVSCFNLAITAGENSRREQQERTAGENNKADPEYEHLTVK